MKPSLLLLAVLALAARPAAGGGATAVPARERSVTGPLLGVDLAERTLSVLETSGIASGKVTEEVLLSWNSATRFRIAGSPTAAALLLDLVPGLTVTVLARIGPDQRLVALDVTIQPVPAAPAPSEP